MLLQCFHLEDTNFRMYQLSTLQRSLGCVKLTLEALNCQPQCFACCEYVFLLSLLCMVEAEGSGISIKLPYSPPYNSNPLLKWKVGKWWVKPKCIYICVWVSFPKSAHFNVNQKFSEHFDLYNDHTHAVATPASFLENTPSRISLVSTQFQAAPSDMMI